MKINKIFKIFLLIFVLIFLIIGLLYLLAWINRPGITKNQCSKLNGKIVNNLKGQSCESGWKNIRDIRPFLDRGILSYSYICCVKESENNIVDKISSENKNEIDNKIGSYSWKTGAESVKEYVEFKNIVANLEKKIGCSCEQNCSICKSENFSWYYFYFLEDKFIVKRYWEDMNHSPFIEVYEYTLEGNKGSVLCAETTPYWAQKNCSILNKLNEDNTVGEIASRIYRESRIKVIENLSGKAKIENILFDIYVGMQILKPENNIHDIYTISYDKFNIQIKNNILYYELEGGEVKDIVTYTIETQPTIKLFCEDTWEAGGGGGDPFSSSCQIPKGSMEVIDYLNSLK